MASPRTLYIDRTVRAEPEYVFDAIAHADALARISGGIRNVDELQPGSPEPYGAGAVRRVDFGAVVFEEETLAYDRPRRFEYRIRKARPPFTHHGGSYVVEPAAGGGSRVRWKSTLSVDAPIVGPALTFVLAAVLRRGLMSTLVMVDRNFAAGR